MKRIISGIFIVVVTLTFTSVSQAETAVGMKQSILDFCAEAKEKGVVLWSDHDSVTGKMIAINCAKCSCSKNDKGEKVCTATKVDCPDKK